MPVHNDTKGEARNSNKKYELCVLINLVIIYFHLSVIVINTGPPRLVQCTRIHRELSRCAPGEPFHEGFNNHNSNSMENLL